ncbi:hypothetical protein M5E06_15050 [Azospirillum sp. A1-3]|uniref:hypothetical protein n=1 Tax=Azospirillum sp. A1-3 TaxID=185874 RepID=UPI002077500A|nr:hypothetical protein [Azospirillum sp. A1-3]MCM8735476.1 hypothetical protein [Azospirillum sp. A1-3]
MQQTRYPLKPENANPARKPTDMPSVRLAILFHFGADKAQAARSQAVHSDSDVFLSVIATSWYELHNEYGGYSLYRNDRHQIFITNLI